MGAAAKRRVGVCVGERLTVQKQLSRRARVGGILSLYLQASAVLVGGVWMAGVSC